MKNDNSTIHDFDKIKRKTLETRQWSTTKKKIITDIKSGAPFLGETIFVGVKRFISLLLHNNYILQSNSRIISTKAEKSLSEDFLDVTQSSLWREREREIGGATCKFYAQVYFLSFSGLLMALPILLLLTRSVGPPSPPFKVCTVGQKFKKCKPCLRTYVLRRTS